MAKQRPSFECSSCGHRALAWSGRCAGCGEWNTLEQVAAPTGPGAGKGGRGARNSAAAKPVALRDVQAAKAGRLPTAIGEFDRVLGGGLMAGSLVLIGGSPGIGKSTLTGMALANLSGSGHKVLYVSGEESTAQIKLRAERLGAEALSVPAIASSGLEEVLATLEAERPEVCVIDSVQSLHGAESAGAPGSVAQVRAVAGAIMEVAKRLDIATLLVGHVTKEGALAGPRALEHLVDCVLHFEGERERTYRTLRALKNRFGSTSEVGVFEMRQGGLIEVADPSARFVAEARPAPGSVVCCAMEGTRPVLVEVQALVAPTEMVPPRRTSTGIDRNRLALVLAVLARHGNLQLSSADVFVNVAGGVRIDEPGADLAVALAIVSAQDGRPLAGGDSRHGRAERGGGGRPPPAPERPLACFGELGLTGELRYVGHPDRRVAEARKFGLAPVLGPDAGEDASVPGLRACDSLSAAIASARSRAQPLRQAAA
ncbi:MAG: DNA repair protein RadA [Solirubrobacterales bacterium]